MGRKKKIAAAIFIVAIAAALVYVNEEMKVSWSGWGSKTPHNSTSPEATENTTNPEETPEESTNSTEPEPEPPEPEPPTPEISVNFAFSTDLPTEPFPKTPLKGLVRSNAPYVPVELWRKLKGAKNPYGEPHEWELVSSTSTDSEGSTTFILNPYTGKCGYWQYKAIIIVEGQSYESGIDELTVLGVYIEAVLISDDPQRHELKICVYTSMPSSSGAKVYESWDNWETEDLTFENLTTDEAGFTYGNLITGMSGTVCFRAVGPDGTESYNRFEEVL